MMKAALVSAALLASVAANDVCTCDMSAPCQHLNDISCVKRVGEDGQFVDEGGVCAAGSFDCEVDKPEFPSKFKASFRMTLPYIDLVETVTTHVDLNNGLQRLSYYDDQDVFIYNASAPISYEIVPVVTTRTCFTLGTMEPVTVFPPLDKFKLRTKLAAVNGQQAHEWFLEQEEMDDNGYIGSYSLFVSADGDKTPLQFKMHGHNMIAGGSHFDDYVVDYDAVSIVDEFPAETWLPPPELTCTRAELDDDDGGGPKLQVAPSPSSPLHDLHMLHPQGAKARAEAFDAYAKAHGKHEEYARAGLAKHEVAKKQSNFHSSLRYINAHNRQRHSYTLGANHMADWTIEERKRLNGRQRTQPGENKAAYTFSPAMVGDHNLPDNFDWRPLGAVTKVKDQGTCGSCWSYGTTGAIEGQAFVKTGKLVSLSEQALVDCSWPMQNNGCMGGTDMKAYDWIVGMNGGRVVSDAAYGPYMSQDGYCHVNEHMESAPQLTGYVNVTSGDFEALNTAIAYVGPLSVAINATPNSFYFYKSGLYNNPECSSLEKDIDHQVLAVGYGVTEDGQKYTIVKNSWSTNWGEDGYVRIAQEGNICSVATEPTFPLLA